MQSTEKFSLLRSILRALGLSSDAIDDIVDRIVDFLSDKDEKPSASAEYPYRVRDDFLSPAEQSFYLVLKTIVTDWGLACPKVSLGDLFYVKSSDASEFRVYTNKIDRKHVDFLICDPKTVRPLLGIELDDKSHEREDRRRRDNFVEQVFAAAKVPLLRIPVRQSYSVSELGGLIRQHTGIREPEVEPTPLSPSSEAPHCPKCGSPMVLRTAKMGTNAGEKFWGCSNYPKCRGIVRYQAQS